MNSTTHRARSYTSAPGEAACVGCGCTDLRACPGGCSWLAVNREDGTGVCSNCRKSLTAWRNQQTQDEADAMSPEFQEACDLVDQREAGR